MRTSTKAIRLCAVVPAGIAGSFVALIELGFLTGTGLVLAFASTVIASVALACGHGEGVAARAFGFARALRAGQRTVLAPAIALAESVGLRPNRVLVRLVGTDGVPAIPIGRHTVIVSRSLVLALDQRRITSADAAAAIGHAVASQQAGPARFDLVARLWAFPWALLYAVIRPIARACSGLPAAELGWHLRIVVGVVAVAQGFQPGGDPKLGAATGVLVAISYLSPAADRAWRAVVERDSDRIVASRGLSEPLALLAQRLGGEHCLARVQLIRQAASLPRTLAAPVGRR